MGLGALFGFQANEKLNSQVVEGPIYTILESGVQRGTVFRTLGFCNATGTTVQLLIRDTAATWESGNVIFAKGEVSLPEKPMYPYQFNEYQYAATRGIAGTVWVNDWMLLSAQQSKTARERGIAHIENWPVCSRVKGLYKALIFGDKTEIAKADKQFFSDAGLVHILAVSGLHVGIIAWLLQWMLKYMLKWMMDEKLRWLRSFLIVAGVWGFVALAGFGISVVRAGVLFTTIEFARAAKLQKYTAEAVWMAAFVLLLYQPFALFDLGFQLSFTAVFGIVYGHAWVEKQHLSKVKSKHWKYVLTAISVSLWAQLATTPITLYHFHQFPNYFLLGNLLLLPFVPILLLAGILFLSANMCVTIPQWGWMVLERLSVFFLDVVEWLATLPGAVSDHIYISTYSAWCVFLAVILLIAALYRASKGLLLTSLWLVLMAFYVPVHSNYWMHVYRGNAVLEIREGGRAVLFSSDTARLSQWLYASAKWREAQGVEEFTLEPWNGAALQSVRDTFYSISSEEWQKLWGASTLAIQSNVDEVHPSP